jgi:cysteine desulfurase family protein (TIGR01976 family)
MTEHLNLRWVRSQFPALASVWTFLDNAGGSQTLGRVVDRIADYLRTTNVLLGASYVVSRRASERVDAATRAIAAYVNAADPAEVVLGASSSMLLRVLSIGLGKMWREGDEVIVTDCDHEANIGPWADLAERGIAVKTWAVNRETWNLETDDLERLMTPRTRLVALTHASNLIGTIHPIRDIARFVHERGALLCVDGVAFAPHRRVDVQAFDADFYAFSFYKVYGPHCAMLFGRRALLEKLPRFNHFFLDGSVPYRLQPGKVNYELTHGIGGLPEYVEELGRANGSGDGGQAAGSEALEVAFDRIARHEEALAERLLAFLRTRRGVNILGLSESDRGRRVPTISFVAEGKSCEEIVQAVDGHRIGIRWGDFYARRLVDALGLPEGALRVSLVHYNTIEEVDRLVGVLERVL